MSGFVNLGPKTPFGSPFEVSLFPSNSGMNLLGSIPIVGIFVGAKRIAAISAYSKNFGDDTKVAQVIIEDLGNGIYETQSLASYKRGHYFRGISEILGLGIVLTILEFIASIFQTIILIFLMLIALLTFALVIPITFVCSIILDLLPKKQIINKDAFKEMNESDYLDKVKDKKGDWLGEPINVASLFKKILREKILAS
ncbi:hypothetical protein O1W69_04690 [Chlamydia sp. 12-01]|uniref:hypothetical protein n=1 Tax=Chlamydia sp. 12-01 TaxID=3002742 RepID=UPI0035D4EE57